MAKKRNDAFDDLIDVAAILPWWAGAALALASYLILHLVAGMPVSAPKGLQGLGDVIVGQFVRVLAMFGQYLLPIAFLCGAVISAIRQLKRGPNNHRNTSPFDDYLEQNRNRVDRSSGADLPQNQRKEPSWGSAPPDSTAEANIDTTRWPPELLAALEWKRFEEVCAGLFERLGFETKMQKRGADSGIDICLFQSSSNLPAAIVQCKAWKQNVGVNLIRELRGVMAAEGVKEGIFVTSGGYTDDAVAFASTNHIDLMDGKAVLAAIRKLSEEQQASLLRLATDGDYTTPTCASCGVKMVLRTPKSGGSKPFWGCVNYPKCTMKLNVARA